jgi:hypothetical protein
MLVLRRVLSMGLLCGELVGQLANHRNGELMSERGYTPKTEQIREAVEANFEHNTIYNWGFPDTNYPNGAGFDLWLAERDLAAFDAGFAHGAEYGHVSQGMWPTH